MPLRFQFETHDDWLMSLRLWYVGQAITGLVVNGRVPSGEEPIGANLAAWAVAFADAVLGATGLIPKED